MYTKFTDILRQKTQIGIFKHVKSQAYLFKTYLPKTYLMMKSSHASNRSKQFRA